MKVTPREDILPVVTDEGAIDAFQGWMCPLITLGIELIVQMNLFQHDVVKKAAELPHLPTIKPIIALVLSPVDHVEITA
jgi:hypothetical protein